VDERRIEYNDCLAAFLSLRPSWLQPSPKHIIGGLSGAFGLFQQSDRTRHAGR
jgi:hypothetical protein